MKPRSRGYRQLVEADLDLLPMMNLFVAIIPMLLISAVFLKVTVIDMNAPADAANAMTAEQNLALSISIRKDAYVIEGEGLPRRVIDRAEDGADDALATALSEVVAAHPGTQDVVIVSQPHTRYGDIVAVMDISRENGLPAVSLLGEN